MVRVGHARRWHMVWLLAAAACAFDSSGGGDDSAGSLGEPTSTSGGPTLTTTSAGTTGMISEATEGSTEVDPTDTGNAESTTADDGPTTETEGRPLQLDDEGVIVRYYLDETDQGTQPTHALDDIPPGFDLLHDWGPEMSYEVDAKGNAGLRWPRAEQDGGPRELVIDSKVRQRLEGNTTATIEIVADVRDVAMAGGSRIVAIGHGNADLRLGLVAENSKILRFRWRNNKNAADWEVELSSLGRAVFHVVLDTGGDEDERVQLYIDGAKLPVIKGADWPSDAQSIDFHNSSELVLGNRPPGQRSFEGVLYYAALYDVAFAENRIAHHVAVLSASDDRP